MRGSPESTQRRGLPFLRDLPAEVTVLAAIAFCVALGFGILIPAIPIFARSFGVSALAASAVISAFALARLVTSPLSGSLVNRLGERAVLSSGLLIVAVSSALAGLSQDYAQLLILRSIGGLGSSMFTVSASALLLRVTAAHQRGQASAAFQGGFLLGGVAGPAVGGLVVGMSIRAPFFVYAATLAIAAVVAMVFLSHARLAAKEEEVALAEGGAVAEDRAGGWPELRNALRHSAYRAALGANLSTGLVTFGLRSALVPLFVVEGLRQSASLAGLAFLMAAGGQAALLLPAGRMSDRVGRRPALLIGSVALLVGMLAMTASDLLANDLDLSTGIAVGVFLLAMIVMGVGSAFLGSAPSAVVGDVMGGRRGGSVIAAFQMIGDFGSVVGPLLAGVLVDALDYDWAFFAGAIVCAAALVLVARMQETLHQS